MEHRMLFCSKEGHESEPANRVCLQSACRDVGLLCQLCVQASHKKHKTQHQKTFLRGVGELAPLRFNFGEIDKNFLNSKHAIQKLRTSLNRGLDHLEQQVTSEYELQKDSLRRIYAVLNSDLEQFFSDCEHSAEADRRLKDLIALLFSEKSDLIKLWKVDQLANCYSNKFKTITQQIQSLTESLVGKVWGMDTCLRSTVKPSFVFSSKLKGSKIAVKDDGKKAVQESNESSGQRFVLAEPSLSSVSSDKVEFAIKVANTSSWIGVGVGLKKELAKLKYMFHYQSLGHGAYIISNNGYSWSHSVTEQNYVEKSFKFAGGDVILVEWNYGQRQLVFRKKGQPASYSMTLAPANGDEYVICANLCTIGDAVSILDEQ